MTEMSKNFVDILDDNKLPNKLVSSLPASSSQQQEPVREDNKLLDTMRTSGTTSNYHN